MQALEHPRVIREEAIGSERAFRVYTTNLLERLKGNHPKRDLSGKRNSVYELFVEYFCMDESTFRFTINSGSGLCMPKKSVRVESHFFSAHAVEGGGYTRSVTVYDPELRESVGSIVGQLNEESGLNIPSQTPYEVTNAF